MTKADIISKIAEKTGVEKAYVAISVESFLDVVKDTMGEGDNIYIRGFGTFLNKKRAKKIARNISKDTSIIIEEHYIPSFKPSKFFVEKIKSSDKVKKANATVK